MDETSDSVTDKADGSAWIDCLIFMRIILSEKYYKCVFPPIAKPLSVLHRGCNVAVPSCRRKKRMAR